jgi:hypothetical protein
MKGTSVDGRRAAIQLYLKPDLYSALENFRRHEADIPPGRRPSVGSCRKRLGPALISFGLR